MIGDYIFEENEAYQVISVGIEENNVKILKLRPFGRKEIITRKLEPGEVLGECPYTKGPGKYIHLKTGKEYIVLSDDFRLKENGVWREGLVLYKAMYKCDVDPWFSRLPEDFYKKFKRVG